jgi:hypothetical protein
MAVCEFTDPLGMTRRRAIDAAAVLVVGWIAGLAVYSSTAGRVVFVIAWTLFVIAVPVGVRWSLTRSGKDRNSLPGKVAVRPSNHE